MNDDKLEIDWEASKIAWIDDARRVLLPQLSCDNRFPDSAKLAQRFEAEVFRMEQSAHGRAFFSRRHQHRQRACGCGRPA